MNKTQGSNKDLSLNEQIDDLRERMRLLQGDRKVNIDVLEANKNSNKDEIKRLRVENKDLRVKGAQLQRASAMEEAGQEVRHVEREIERLRKQYDELANKSVKCRMTLDTMMDEVKDLELDSKRPHMEDNEHTRRIRALENKLDKAMIKYNEAQSIRKTYEQIVRRLREERVGFDNQLGAIERTMGAKQRDYEELLLLQGDANHARETALGELDRVRAGYQEERVKREKELRSTHQMVQSRRQIIERMKHRDKVRKSLAGQDDFDTKTQSQVNAATQKLLTNERMDARSKIDIFENAFRKIKEATGVSDVNEVIQKIISQESSTENLISLTRENQSKIENLNDHKRKLKAKVEEIKYSGVGGGHRRKMVDDHEDQLANSSARLERSRLKYERLCKGLIAMKAGVGHLQEKLEVVRDDVGGKRIELSDETVAEVLRECELGLVALSKRIKAGEEEKKRSNLFAIAPAATYGYADEDRDLDEEAELAASRPYNQRIALSLYDDDDGDDGGGNMGGEEPSLDQHDEDELTRDKVKRASQQILLAIDRKKRKPKKRGAGGHAHTMGSPSHAPADEDRNTRSAGGRPGSP
jgi:hypothetical protein